MTMLLGFGGGNYGSPSWLANNQLASETLNLDINVDFKGRTIKSAVEYLDGLVDQINEL